MLVAPLCLASFLPFLPEQEREPAGRYTVIAYYEKVYVSNTLFKVEKYEKVKCKYLIDIDFSLRAGTFYDRMRKREKKEALLWES